MNKPFEELAQEWVPRAKRFLGLIADQLAARVKARLPSLVSGSAFIIAAVFCIGGIAAWLSEAAWEAFREAGFSNLVSALFVSAAFAIFAVVFLAIGRRQALKPAKKPIESLVPENHEIEEAGQELVTLFKDLTIAAKRSLNPAEVLKPHAAKVVAASTAVGFLVALNIHSSNSNSRKEN